MNPEESDPRLVVCVDWTASSTGIAL